MLWRALSSEPAPRKTLNSALPVPPGLDWTGRCHRAAAPHPRVALTSATTRDVRRVPIPHNGSWDPAPMPLPAAVQEVLTRTAREANQSVEVCPWDVQVLSEHG